MFLPVLRASVCTNTQWQKWYRTWGSACIAGFASDKVLLDGDLVRLSWMSEMWLNFEAFLMSTSLPSALLALFPSYWENNYPSAGFSLVVVTQKEDGDKRICRGIMNVKFSSACERCCKVNRLIAQIYRIQFCSCTAKVFQHHIFLEELYLVI